MPRVDCTADVICIADHPYFAGLQAHPEFCTRPLNPSPAFLGFIASAAGVLPEQIERQKDYVAPVRGPA